MFRNITLKCLTEIAGIQATHYQDMFIALFTQTGQQLEHVSVDAYDKY
jgi:exportin, putative